MDHKRGVENRLTDSPDPRYLHGTSEKHKPEEKKEEPVGFVDWFLGLWRL